MRSHIHNILFDLGMVMIYLDYRSTLEKLAPHCDPKRFISGQSFFRLVEQDPVLSEYERGTISAEAFYAHFVEISGFRGDFEAFQTIWRSIFTKNEPMIALGHELSQQYDVYFLSNACDLHVPYVYELLPSLKFFKDDAISCYLHVAKPDKDFYIKALDKFGIQPDTCLFIDDKPENVAGAEACGIASILYQTPEQTIAAIRERLDIGE